MPKLISIPVSDIIMNVEDNSRRFTSASVEDMTMQLLEANKQLEPVGVVKIKTGENKGRYRLAYGFRRVHALKDISDGQLAAEGSPLYSVQALLHEDVDPTDDKTIYLMNVAENAHRKEITAIDRAIQVTKMMDEFGMDATAVSKVLGVSRSMVSQIKALMKLPLEVQQAIEAKVLSGDMGYQIAKEKDETAQLKLFHAIIGKASATGKKPTGEDLKEARREQAEEAINNGEVAPENLSVAARAISATRSWKKIAEFLDIYRTTDDKKLKSGRQKLVEALEAYQAGGSERTFRKLFEQYVPE